ncbi:hypothetical protein ACHAXN_007604 [Cyclotella atomus]
MVAFIPSSPLDISTKQQVSPSSLNVVPLKSTRRNFISFALIAAAGSLDPSVHNIIAQQSIASAAETIGKDPSCNDSSCLGVWDGLLADCPHEKNLLGGVGAGCVSSQDDTPGIFAEPWDYSDSVSVSSNDNAFERQMDLLILALETTAKERRDEVKIQLQSGRYLRAIITDGTSGETSVGEFYFTPNDTTVQFRIASMKSAATKGLGRSLSNIDRSERIRKAMRYTKVPVLRNRKRTFFFVESDQFDSFGPGYSEALGPPEELSPGELNESTRKNAGRAARLSDDVDPRLRIDWVESFPIKDVGR